MGKEDLTMTRKMAIRMVLAAVALTCVAAAAQALGFNHENTLKFTRPVALPGVVLPAGTYSFDVASPTALDVVVVRTADRRKVMYMGFTRTIARPRHMSSAIPIAFGEASANEPPPIAAWYEINATTGHEFIYR
jgi:hypothetical protein